MHKSWMWKQRSYREQFQGDETGSAGGSAAEAQQVDASQDQGDEQPEGETPNGEHAPTGEGDDHTADDGVIVTIGDETPPAATEDEIEGKPAPAWVKELRKQARELARENRELKQAQQAAQQAAQPQAVEVGREPSLEDEDINFDPDVFKQKWTAWNGRKQQAEAQAAKVREEQEAAAAAWNTKVTAYKTAKAALKVDDFDGAEHVVQSTLSPLQQNVILHGIDKPELVVYALGSNPAKAKELAAITDPVKFAIAVGKLETQLKVTPRRAPPAPERQVRGTAGGATIDNTLERLEAEADRTGDRSKIVAYKRDQRAKQAA